MKKKVPIFIIVLSFLFAFIFFFPILWMLLCSIKEEVDVVNPSLFFSPTLKHYKEIFSGNIMNYLTNSIFVTIMSIFFSMVLGVPVAYALVMGKFKNKKGDDLFFWFISTILLPPVCVIVPVYVIFRTLGLLDNHWGLIFIYTAIHIPIVIWMMKSFFSDIPYELIEGARVDGAGDSMIFFRMIMPLSRNGISATILLIFIFIWNEFFFALSLTYTQSATIPIFVSAFMTQEGLFWAKMCAVSTIASLPPMLLGWINQKQLTRGLTMGAVKG